MKSSLYLLQAIKQLLMHSHGHFIFYLKIQTLMQNFEELKSINGDTRAVSVEDIPKLEYAEKVIRVTLALEPKL